MIKWFNDINLSDFNLVGGKAYNLSRLFNYGIKVPKGFVVTTSAYDAYIQENQLKQKLHYILNNGCPSVEKSKEIKALFNVESNLVIIDTFKST